MKDVKQGSGLQVQDLKQGSGSKVQDVEHGNGSKVLTGIWISVTRQQTLCLYGMQ